MLYEIWHFGRVEKYDPVTKSGGLFTTYVNTFVKMKQESSGWLEWCKTEAVKDRYIREYYETYGIPLEYKEIVRNKGVRALAKLILNSFWGKFGQ